MAQLPYRTIKKLPREIDTINQWHFYPDTIVNTNGKFLGYWTKDDITQIKGGFPVGQNISFTSAKTPTPRPGSKLIGTAISSSSKVKRAWTFQRRDGVEIEMKTYGTGVYFLVNDVMTDYQLLETGFTADQEFGYAVISKPDNVNSYVNFCNGIESWRKWNGEYALIQSFDNTAHTITTDTQMSNAAYLVSGNNVTLDASQWASITNGSFRITIDGVARNVDGINFTGVATLADVAAKIQTALRAVTTKLETVEYLDTNQFKITTVNSVSSAITAATTSTGTVGTDISGVGGGMPTINCQTGAANITNLEVLHFLTSGLIMINGTRYSYSSFSNKTLTGVSDMTGLVAPAGTVVVQATEVFANNGVTISSIADTHDGKIYARNESKKSVFICSKTEDPWNWTNSIPSADGDGFAKEIEQGGPITAISNDEQKVYIFKTKSITTLEYIQNSSNIAVPKFTTLKPSNDKSTTIGAIGQKSTFTGPNGVFFVTTDKQLIYLYRQDFKDYPQQMDLADPIRPTFASGVHDEATGIVYNSKVYYAYKQDSHSTYNDTVIVYDLIRQMWSAPYVGWNVSDWSVVASKLRWHSSVSPDTYELDDTSQQDGDFPFTTILRSWSETFGSPEFQKKIGYVMIEIYLQENSNITATVLFDENGYNGQEEFILDGSNIQYRLGSENYNVFGANAFGEERFGSNADISGMNKYRFILELKKNIIFYNVSLQLSTNTPNCNYELIRFGYFLTDLIQQPDINYMLSPDGTADNLNIQ